MFSSLPGLGRFSPEPVSRNGGSFNAVLRGLDAAVSGAGSVVGGGMDPQYAALLAAQIETQQQMQLVSFESNIEKSKHETQMAAVRNIRVG